MAAILIQLKDGNGRGVGVELFTRNSQVVTSWPATLQHNLSDSNASLTAAYGVHPNGWYPVISVLSKTLNTLVISGSVDPPPGGAALDWRVDA